MKRIVLKPKAPLYSSMDIDVMDYPNDDESKELRRRCKITVEYGSRDIRDLKDRGLDFDGAMDYYQNYIYDTVRFLIADDWEPISGMDEALEIIREKVADRF